ncbi:hypothetical protein FGB62_166g042 [Gracilaria domingensis]|nr:hypothetical protein FGB62_166g042 [Gracilaria domingensis]
MRLSFALGALSALVACSSAVVVKPDGVGPLSPDKNPSTSLEESIRRMKLSLDRELVYLAHMEDLSRDTDTDGLVVRQQDEPAVIHGFTTAANDGTGVFRPILPGSDIPPARMLADDPMESPIEETDDGMETTPPSITVIETPIFTPPVEPVPFTPVPELPVPTQLPVLPTEAPEEPVESTPPREVVLPPGVVDPPTTTDEETTPTVVPEGPEDPAVPTDGEVTDEAAVPTDEDVDDGSTLSPPGVVGDAGTDLGPTEEELLPSPDDDDPVCFPAHATVQLEDGSVKKMADVQIGDRVLVAPQTYSEVFMFTHKLSQVRHNFVHLELSSGHELSLTHGHYLYVNGRLSAASTVNKGDTLMLADSSLAKVSRVSSIQSTGLFNPQTVQGDIVVNGVLASTYTTAVEPKIAHALLAPLRAAYSRVGFCMTAFEAGADMIANFMPSGSIIY